MGSGNTGSRVMEYDGFAIESFEAGRGLWHARIRRTDGKPVVIDGIPFSELEAGFAWSSPDSAIADAKTRIDSLNRHNKAVGQTARTQRSAA
jgi:hypothetical protein